MNTNIADGDTLIFVCRRRSKVLLYGSFVYITIHIQISVQHHPYQIIMIACIGCKLKHMSWMFASVARWLVCHWGRANTQTAAPPPRPRTHTQTHMLPFCQNFLQGRMQDFGEEGVGSTWIIDALMIGRGAREARENFCGARSNLSTDCIGN